MTIMKATPADAGCYCEGWWGQYGSAHMIMRASEFGFGDQDPQAVEVAGRKLDAMGPRGGPEISLDEEEYLAEKAGEAEDWLNANAAPDGYRFGWSNGEFYLWSDEDWEEAGENG
jgi:hypothetical protein